MNRDDLIRRRTALRLTQVQLAEMLDVHPLTVTRWERGTRKLPRFLDLALQTIERDAASVVH